jgi:hypothetical protein
MSNPENKFPLQEPTGAPKVDAAEQDVITNKDETNKAVNKGGAVADMDGIQETLSEDEPSFDLNVDKDVTNADAANTGDTDNIV